MHPTHRQHGLHSFFSLSTLQPTRLSCSSRSSSLSSPRWLSQPPLPRPLRRMDSPLVRPDAISKDILLTKYADTSSQASLASTSVALPSSSSVSNATGDATDEVFVAALSGRGQIPDLSQLYSKLTRRSSATYYTPNNNYGACGKRIKNSEHAVALSSDKYAGGAHCGKKITAHRECIRAQS